MQGIFNNTCLSKHVAGQVVPTCRKPYLEKVAPF